MGDRVNAGKYSEIYRMVTVQLAGANGSGEQGLNAFTAFAAGLKPEQLQTFPKSYLDAPVPLTGDDRSNFLSAAAAAGEKAATLANRVDGMLAETSANRQVELSAFLAAATKAGPRVADLLTATANTGRRSGIR